MYSLTNLYYNLATVEIFLLLIMYDKSPSPNILFQLKSQFPTRPIVLIGFSLAGRIAAKVSVLQGNPQYVCVIKSRQDECCVR